MGLSVPPSLGSKSQEIKQKAMEDDTEDQLLFSTYIGTHVNMQYIHHLSQKRTHDIDAPARAHSQNTLL